MVLILGIAKGITLKQFLRKAETAAAVTAVAGTAAYIATSEIKSLLRRKQ